MPGSKESRIRSADISSKHLEHIPNAMEKTESKGKTNGVVTEQPTNWHSINWKKAYRMVRKLRRRIFRATREGNWKKVRTLQKLLLKSRSNILISVRQATQINQGKETPGVDKKVALTPKEREELVDALRDYKAWKPIPVRRILIPKKNGKKRPLGIPSIIDRCLQSVVKKALEPCWEEQFEGISYGFRPKRSCHDARQRIFLNIKGENNKKWWVVDADIKGCFDNINHEALLKKIGNFPARKLIRDWLKAGYVDKNVFYETEQGTPQGGIISPLLANIALHGMEKALGIEYTWNKDKRNEEGGFFQNKTNKTLVRYADDFVILCENKEEAENHKETIAKWLRNNGLELSEEKTRIVHLTEGFDFLGWNFRKYKCTTRRTGYITLIKPNRENVQAHKDKLKEAFKSLKGCPVGTVIKKLNPIIRGWTNYHSGAVSKEIFSSINDYLFTKLRKWARRMHPKKSWEWQQNKYWGKLCPGRDDKWVFGDKSSGHYVLKPNWTKIKRHTAVTHKHSPDDPSLKEYWEKRSRKQEEITATQRFSTGKDKIARSTEYKCTYCGQSLGELDNLHVHHIVPKCVGGKDTYDNLIYLHDDCHQTIHALGATNPDIQALLRAGKTKPKKGSFKRGQSVG